MQHLMKGLEKSRVGFEPTSQEPHRKLGMYPLASCMIPITLPTHSPISEFPRMGDSLLRGLLQLSIPLELQRVGRTPVIMVLLWLFPDPSPVHRQGPMANSLVNEISTGVLLAA